MFDVGPRRAGPPFDTAARIMLAPVELSLARPQGDTVPLLATVAEDAYEQPVTDATGWTLVVAVKTLPADTDAEALIILDGTSQTISGNIVRQLLATSGLASGEYFYTARLIDPTANIFTWQSGRLYLLQPVLDTPGDVTPASPAGAVPGSRPLAFTTAAELTALVTAGRTRGRYISGSLNGALVNVVLLAGNGDYVPDDYNATTNARGWFQIG